MSGLIKNLEEIAPEEELLEGTFISNIFSSEDGNELSIIIQNSGIIDYAEKCVEHFNSLSDDIIDEICHGLIESCHLSDEDFELPELENVREILEYCWFTAMSVIEVPEEYGIAYVIEGEGDWGETFGFVIKNGSLVYKGIDYNEYL